MNPIMRPDFNEFSVDVCKLVASLNVAPYKFADVKLQMEKVEPVKFVFVKSTPVIFSLVYDCPLPTMTIVMSASALT